MAEFILQLQERIWKMQGQVPYHQLCGNQTAGEILLFIRKNSILNYKQDSNNIKSILSK